MLVFNEAIDEEVIEMMQGCGTDNYTRINGIFGKGNASGTHLDTDTWPGRNNSLLAAIPDERAAHALECIRKLRKSLGAKGVKAFLGNLEAVT
jgi:hypothetical protein